MKRILGKSMGVVLLGVPFAVVGMFIILTAAATETPGNWLLSAIAGAVSTYLFISALLVTVWATVCCRTRRRKELVAEARSRGGCSREEALKMTEQAAELDDQEGLGEVKVVTDEEE